MATVCASCGFHNPPGMRFCGNCGTKLAQDVPESPPPPVLAPEHLGVLTGSDLLDRFRKAGLEAAGQRRSVTVLFVDLSGYTHLSEDLDDEDLYELVQGFIRLLIDDVYKYEGMVDKLTGDGLMALFGAPIAHENNAERALRCALDMLADVERMGREVDLHGHNLRIHLGLNAGSVIVGGLGSDMLMNYTAIGDSVNLARRLEEAASPGTVLVSESVHRQAARLFDFEPLPALTLKNVSHPVTAFRLVGPKQRPGRVRGLEGLRAPMIGRENEFRRVQHMVERLVNDRQGGLVLLSGEGGMGKSRLTSELKASVEDSSLRILEGHSLTYRKSIAYWIFQDVLRNYLGASLETPEAELRVRLKEAVLALIGMEGKEKIAYLEHMFSLKPSDQLAAERIGYLDAGQLRQQVFLAVRDLLTAEARRRPVMLILEDLHWADDASQNLVRFLLDSTSNVPLLIYAISRPFDGGVIQAIHEHAARRLGDRYLYLRLQALPPDRSAELLRALLTIQDLPRLLQDQIIQRSAGLPFYLEEILRMLIEKNIIYRDPQSGSQGQWRLSPGASIDSIGVPETLQGLILARFDRLNNVQRRVLQTATVIGYEFSEQVLQKVLSVEPGSLPGDQVAECLSFLVEHEYIFPLVEPLGSGERSYVFRHVLVSDAVYSTLLQRDRRDLHTRAGQAIEELFADRLDRHIEVLAGHFLRSRLLDRALHYQALAGQKAARSFANEQARQYFSQASELLPKVEHTPEQAMQIYLGLGDALLTAGDYPAARERFHRGLQSLGARASTGSLSLPRQVDASKWAERKRLLSLLQRKIARTHESQGEYDKALAYLQAAQSLLEGDETGSMAERANILSDMGWIDFRRGALDQAEAALRQALTLAETAGQPDVLASVLNRLGGVYFQRNDPAEAARYLVRSLVLREQIGDVVAVARSYNNLGLLGWKQGNLTNALDYFNHSFQLQENLGDVEGLIVLLMNMGLIEIDLGNLQQAEHHFQEALQSASQIGHHFHISEARMNLALMHVYAGNWERALEHGRLGLSGFQEIGVQENLLDLNVSLGWAYLGLGEEARLEEVLQRIHELMKEDGSGSPVESEGRALRLIGRIACQHGDSKQAMEVLSRSKAIFTQLGNAIETGRILLDIASLMQGSGEMAPARSALREARSIFERIGARLELARLQDIETQMAA